MIETIYPLLDTSFHCTKHVQNPVTCYTTILPLRKLSFIHVMLLVAPHQNKQKQMYLLPVETSEKHADKMDYY